MSMQASHSIQLISVDVYKRQSLFRYNDGTGKRENIEFASNLKHQFKKEDHKLTFDVSISKGLDDDRFAIVDVVNEKNDIITDQVRCV